ncbi:Hypothetical predicted protein [Podarcis lilfordi]|uniref:Uncharacterized protein n=1 Tax=Podarcis lilfordi TaxID=74358 RepID=A0AA35KLE8_9SAUR|nr:Hypothetical predicted protein [Podarcis lilfordi]
MILPQMHKSGRLHLLHPLRPRSAAAAAWLGQVAPLQQQQQTLCMFFFGEERSELPPRIRSCLPARLRRAPLPPSLLPLLPPPPPPPLPRSKAQWRSLRGAVEEQAGAGALQKDASLAKRSSLVEAHDA